MATSRARLIARWLSDSSRFSDGRPLARSFAHSLARPSPVRAAGFFSLVSHGRWKEEGHGGVDGERKSWREGGREGEKGDPSCVVLVESSVNSEPRCRVVCGMLRCLASRRRLVPREPP